ncbi:MAG: hypothetical protein Tsb005_17810 [Gammaproteobacteria bacterium]
MTFTNDFGVNRKKIDNALKAFEIKPSTKDSKNNAALEMQTIFRDFFASQQLKNLKQNEAEIKQKSVEYV